MKGIIRENLGDSRYIVGVKINAEPGTAILQQLNQSYSDAEQKLIEWQGKLGELRKPYNAKLSEIDAAIQDYQLCLNKFTDDACNEERTTVCRQAYSACQDECYSIESGPGECDLSCQAQRESCFADCRRERDACLERIKLECAEAKQAHVTACQEEYGSTIATLQSEALDLLPPIQEALIKINELEALKLALARRANELDGVVAREEQITCFRAQYDDGLEVETNVDVARTPGGRTVITEIVAPAVCLQDSRALPSSHVFINAAIHPGSETWRPTWRTGIVQEVLIEENKLKVEIKSGELPGTLGTNYSANPINCTPPQDYFDGNWAEAENRIKEARKALIAAQQELTNVGQAIDDCIAQYDQNWVNGCYTDNASVCDQVWSQWLTACEDAGGSDCQAQYQASLAICYRQALYNCSQQQADAIDGCREFYADFLAEAQTAADDASASLALALAGHYQPANPLIIEVQVEHCAAGIYQIGDDVLIDFPTRSGNTPMATWDSARVIGWASNTRVCCCGGFSLDISGTNFSKAWFLKKTSKTGINTDYHIVDIKNIISCDKENDTLKLTFSKDIEGADSVTYLLQPNYPNVGPCEFEMKITPPNGYWDGQGNSPFTLSLYGTTPPGVLPQNVPLTDVVVYILSALNWHRFSSVYNLSFPYFQLTITENIAVEIALRHGKGVAPAFCEPPIGYCPPPEEGETQGEECTYDPLTVSAQIAALYAAYEGASDAESAVRAAYGDCLAEAGWDGPKIIACNNTYLPLISSADQATKDSYKAFYAYRYPLPYADLVIPTYPEGSSGAYIDIPDQALGIVYYP